MPETIPQPEPGPIEVPWLLIRAMVDHCRREAPLEACGIMAGKNGATVDRLYPLRNELASQTRYQADPRDLIAAVQSIRAEHSAMLGIYHSHPASAAIPSQTDLRLNQYGRLPCFIISLAGRVPEVRAWRLEPDHFEPIAWRVLRPRVARLADKA